MIFDQKEYRKTHFKMNHHYPRLLLLIALLTFTFSNLTADPNEREVRIGVMASLTGDYASAGDEIRRGISIAEKQLKSSGIPLTVIYEDACLPAQGVTSIKKLIEQDRIHALVSNYCLISLNAISPIITEYKLPTLQNSVTPESMVNASPLIYSSWPSIEDEVRAIIGQFNEEDFNQVAIFFLESPWGITYAEALKAELKARGKTPALEASQGFGQHDFKAEIAKLKAAKASKILLAHTGANLVSFLKQARRAGIRADSIYVPSDADHQDIVNAAGDASEGLALMISESPNKSKSGITFEDSYVSEYHRPSAPLGRHAYDQMMLAVTAIKECNFDQECTRAKLDRTNSYDGATGIFSLKNNHLAQRIFYRRQVTKGKFEFVPAQVQ
jgi:branched-chain amino acid transport system substrate-binding protein